MVKSTDQTVWVIHAGRRGSDASAFERAGVVGLSLPPVAGLASMSRPEGIVVIEHALAAKDPFRLNSGRDHVFAAILLRFVYDVQIADRVITPDTASREILGGEITGPYEFAENPAVPGYHHVRTVVWLGRIPRSDLSQQLLRSVGAPIPLYQPGTQAQLAALALWHRGTHGE